MGLIPLVSTRAHMLKKPFETTGEEGEVTDVVLTLDIKCTQARARRVRGACAARVRAGRAAACMPHCVRTQQRHGAPASVPGAWSKLCACLTERAHARVLGCRMPRST